VRPPWPRLLLAASLGGALGALLRYLLGELAPDGSGFPWTTFAINVVGSLLLALLPALAMVRQRLAVAVALGPGVLGGFTTLSAYAEQSRALVAEGETLLAAAYLLGTLFACLLAVNLASHWSSPAARDEFAAEGGDE
jgi:fluoride exporter